VTLNESQRSHIQQTVFARSDVPRVDRVDFALAFGTVVPERVHVVAVPDALWEINPEWRSDMYFVSGDDIIIVDNSRRIVAVVASGPSTAMNSGTYNSYASARGSRSGASVNLSSDEIRQLQIALNEKGFNVGSPDGVFGARTRQALIAFQRQQGFQANGEIDQQSMSALGVSANGNMGGKTTGAGGQSSSSTAAPSSSGQAGGSNMPASRNGSSMNGQGRSNLPSSSTSGQGGTGSTGSTDMPSHTQGTGGSTNPRSGTGTGTSGSTNLPSNQSR
jgi:peptidoglycan hydrolase-like protein with peptidoglycan-binding domain